ncbi:MAG: aminotransferase class I/II-fold pyridoxal phosphate-dependent enzyme [Pyrinomonadaceae bacterium]
MSELSINTQLVHAGERRGAPEGKPVATPIYASATYTYDSMAEVDKVFEGAGGDYVYSRYGNPTVAALESAMAIAEGGKFAVAYASGMAALHATLIACELSPGSVVLASKDLYGASFDLLYKVFGSFGVKTQTADFSDLEELATKVADFKPRVLLAETISNPLLKVCDIPACAAIAHEAHARLVIDNTFASPFLCRPLGFGADLVVHSATKYLSGHADAMGGIVVSNEEFDKAALVGAMKLVGGVLSVWEAHQILRGIKTLALRLERQCGNAQILAKRLSDHPKVGHVFKPGFGGDTELAWKILREPFAGALVTIRLKDDTREAAFRFMDALKLCVRATSLGDIYTLVSHSASSSHRELSPKKRAEVGISEGLVRISVGIEDVGDIVADIEQALETE